MNDYAPITNIDVNMDASFEDIQKRVAYSTSLNLKPIVDCSAWRSDKHIAIVGGGPSLKDNLDELRRYKNIMACGSVHDYLIRNGIYPKWCVVCDPDPIVVDYLQEKNIITEYLIASQCHSKVFEHLKYNKTFLWHSGGSDEENALCKFPDTDYIIGGGCTVGTRAIVIGIHFGYENIDLFGFDSCLKDDAHHAYEFVNDTETVGDVYEIKIGDENGPTFKVAGYMLAQIKDFQAICNIYSKTIRFSSYGDGLLSYILREATRIAAQTKEKT